MKEACRAAEIPARSRSILAIGRKSLHGFSNIASERITISRLYNQAEALVFERGANKNSVDCNH